MTNNCLSKLFDRGCFFFVFWVRNFENCLKSGKSRTAKLHAKPMTVYGASLLTSVKSYIN